MGEKPFQILPERRTPGKEPEGFTEDGRETESEFSGYVRLERETVPPDAGEGGPLPMGGLSEDEVRDLDVLIRSLKNKPVQGADDEKSPDASLRARDLENRLAEMAGMLLKFDGSLKILFELLRLFQRKSEILNHRIQQLEKLFRRHTN